MTAQIQPKIDPTTTDTPPIATKPEEKKDLVQQGISTLTGLIKDNQLKDMTSNFMNDSYRNLRNIQQSRRDANLRNIQSKPSDASLREVKQKPSFWQRTKNFFKNIWGAIKSPLSHALPAAANWVSNKWLK